MEILYDRGTLLLSQAPLEWADEPFPGVLWDPRVDAYRAPGRRYAQILAHLVEQGILFHDRVLPGSGRHDTHPDPKAGMKFRLPELRPYQETALDFWEQANRRGILALPTGAGKTLTALTAVARLSRERLCHTLCLVPTRALLEQWSAQLGKYYSGAVGVYGDGSKTLHPITVATYESAYRYIADFGDAFDLVIVDECHHFGVGMRDEILDMAVAPFRLGLTATPPARPEALERLSELIGPIVFELSLMDLAGTYLADFDYLRIPLDLNSSERSRYDLEMALYRRVFFQFRDEYPQGSYIDWIRYASRTEEGRNALSAFQEARKLLSYCQAKEETLDRLLQRHWSQKTLIFTSDTETAYRIARRHLIMPITAEITRTEREEMIARFKNGSIRTLVSCRVLNEGIDVPDAEIAIVLGGHQGPREHVQRIGRTLRPSPEKRAQIYELVCRNTIETRQSRKRNEHLAAPIPAAL